MSKVTYSSLSQYSNTQQTTWYLDVYTDLGFGPDSSDQQIVLDSRFKNRPDKLAYELYGQSSLWYLFYLVNNNISDPIFDMVPGNKIYVPLPQRVADFFGGN